MSERRARSLRAADDENERVEADAARATGRKREDPIIV